jgi:pimeloyl-ACP methyl ester carboxylesterase
VGNGQIVSWARQEALCYATILARARAAGDAKAIAELERIGPPPWRDLACVATKSKYANAMTPVEQAFFASLGAVAMAAMGPPPADATYVPKGLAPVDSMALSMATFAKLWPETSAFDARALGLDFELPMFFFQGELDAHMVTSEVQAYAAEIRAPRKALELIKGAGHMSTFLRDDLLALLQRHVASR